MRVITIINRGGGTAATEGVAALEKHILAAFAAAGLRSKLRIVEGDRLKRAFEEAGQELPDLLVAGGGDGTISLAAGVAARAGLTLGVLPLGTLNHLARDAGIPPSIEAAAKVIAGGYSRSIDLAEVNGRIFVNNSAVGLYPLMVREREQQQSRLGRSKRIAMLLAGMRALRHFKHRRLTIGVEGLRTPIETPLLFVGNNVYQTSILSLGRRASLDGGELCLYALLAHTRRRMIGVALRGLVGLLDQERDFIALRHLLEIEVGSRHPAISLSIDGETLLLETPLRYRILPGALRLLVPEPEPAAR